MSDFITVKINKDNLLDMLLNRCDVWGTSRENKDLFEKMYSNYIDSGVFNEAELNIMVIVDNDVINYTTILEDEDEDFQEVLKLYRQGEYDISCHTHYSFIEAVSDDEERILVRY
jgi:hypothetical protein